MRSSLQTARQETQQLREALQKVRRRSVAHVVDCRTPWNRINMLCRALSCPHRVKTIEGNCCRNGAKKQKLWAKCKHNYL